MKKMRTSLLCFLVAASTGVFSGCASTGHDSYQPVAGTNGIEKKQPSPTEDMTALQQTGYYVGWLSLDFLYAWAGGHPSFSP